MIENMLRKYDDLSISTKFISVILLTLFIFGYVCLVGLQIVNRSNQELLYNTLATSLSYSAKEIKDAMDELDALSFNLIVDSTVQDQLAKLKDQPEDVKIRSEAYKQLNTVLQNFASQNSSISYISLTGTTMDVDTNTVWAEKISEDVREEMQSSAIEEAGRETWIYHQEAQNQLFLVRSVNRIKPHRLDTLGVVTINIDMQKLIEDSGFDGKFGETYYQLTDGDNVLYRTENFPSELTEELSGLDEDEYKILGQGKDRYFTVTGTIPGYNWKYEHLILYNDMYRALRDSIFVYLIVVMAGAGVSILLCHGLVKRLTVHISTLIDKMQAFSQNNEKVPSAAYDYSRRKDELGMLHRKFDEMAEEIIFLIQNDYTNQLIMKDAQLKALEAQIDPHFLYNVLQSISWSAKEIGDQQIPRMVDALGKMLRTTLAPEDEEFTVGKEMEFVGYYMTIQQFRFESQLEFESDIPEEILPVKIPKLTIQPLVENAIRYAMEACEDVCYIEVSGEIMEEGIYITVRNSGSIFEPDLLNKLEMKQIKPNGFGIGLLNIKKRLNLFCGDEAYLKLENKEDRAAALIFIPASHYKEVFADAENDYC